MCIKHPFPSPFLTKVLYLPSILHRLFCLLLSEDLRSNISKFGLLNLSANHEWQYANIGTTANKLNKFLTHIENKQYSSQISTAADIIKSNNKIVSFCNISNNPSVPSPANILEAITLSKANDAFDLERLEIIGDSFLKYCITLKLFYQHNDIDSNKLSNMRTDIIKNTNLFEKACAKQIPLYLITNDFRELQWIPPCFIRKLNSMGSGSQLLIKRKIKMKQIADSVESLIGAHLIYSGQQTAVMFIHYIGLQPYPNENIHLPKDVYMK